VESSSRNEPASPTSQRGRCTVIVGCQWGDEGKGKIVDVLADEVDVVARYQGGANAGHTVHVDRDEFVLHQIPSGILHDGKRCLLGNGVVLDVLQFFEEREGLRRRGIDLDGRVGVSRRAHLLLPYHRRLDQVTEDRASEKIGTTGRGIGPAYEAKAGRRGIRVADLADEIRLRAMLEEGIDRAQERLIRLGAKEDANLRADSERVFELRHELLAMATNTGDEILDALNAGSGVLLEGAQGTALDLDHGTYPFVTSSNTTAAAAATGVGIGPTAIDRVVGVVKAYTTRVGNGPLPTQLEQAMDERMRELGGEFGATTGRPRRCGWFDAVQARYSARVNGLTGLAVTKLDVLDTLEELAICIGYRMATGVTDEFPADTWSMEAVEPVYEILPGWMERTSTARSLEDLPGGARRYLDRIEELMGAPIDMVSVGTERSQIIRLA
jgi:adenylosuccinate synthase